MSEIQIFNETGTDLPHWILSQIKAEMIDYFGEAIHTIRIQGGIQRHAYNAKTREVRYAFFLSDFDYDTPVHSGFQFNTTQLGLTPSVFVTEVPEEMDVEVDSDLEDDDDGLDYLDDEPFEALTNDQAELQGLLKDRELEDDGDLDLI